MYSNYNHPCKDFIVIPTSDAEHVCSKCGVVLEEKVEMQYLTGMQSTLSSIQICDENRHGSANIAPDGFTGDELKKRLNITNKSILSARQKPLRMLFTNTCAALGMRSDYTRTALKYYDTLHEIRTKLKQNASQTNTFSKIITLLKKSKTLTETNIIESMTPSKLWSSKEHTKKWIDETIGDGSFETFSKRKKPKKLSTLNISFFSIYQVVCDNNMRITDEQIAVVIAKHMKFTRKIKIISAMTACKTTLSLEKKTHMETHILKHNVLLESTTLPTEKIKHTYYKLDDMATSKKHAKMLKKQLEMIS